MAVVQAKVTVNAVATIVASNLAKSGKQTVRQVRIQNPAGGQAVFLGDAGVTASLYGYKLAISGEILVPLSSGEVLYGIVSATTQDVYTLNSGNSN